MEWSQPFFEPAVVAIDVIDVEGGRFRPWATGRGQDMAVYLRLSGESYDRFSAIAAQLVGRSNNAVKGCDDRSLVELGQNRISCRAGSISRDQNRNLLC